MFIDAVMVLEKFFHSEVKSYHYMYIVYEHILLLRADGIF